MNEFNSIHANIFLYLQNAEIDLEYNWFYLLCKNQRQYFFTKYYCAKMSIFLIIKQIFLFIQDYFGSFSL